jgi:peptidoglycan/LPS O-acetylase OafA/YrhL
MDTQAAHYRADVDGLRAVAVLAVVGYHFFPGWLPGGFAGVDVFFVISGYLITGIVLREQAAGRFTLSGFYRRRVVRIAPALGVVLGVCAAAALVLQTPADLANLGRHLVAAATMSSNLLLIGEAGYFDRAAEAKPLLHLWSLAVEEQFYLVWPVVLILSARLSWRLRAVALIALTLLSFAVGVQTASINPPVGFYSPLGRAWELLAGACLALYRQRVSERQSVVPGRLRDLSAALGAAAVLASFVALNRGLPHPGWVTLLPVVGAAVLIAAGPSAWVSKVVLARPAWAYVGRISYPWYLWHWPLLVLARPYGETLDLRHWVIVKLLLIALSFVLAVWTYHKIELPWRKRLQQGASMRSLGVPLLGRLVIAAAVGGGFIATTGLPWRAPDVVAGQAALVAELGRDGVCRREGAAGCATAATHWDAIDTLFVGDSHALALFAGAAKDRSAYFGAPGCFPGPGLEWRNLAAARLVVDCSVAGGLDPFLRRLPALRTVVIAARWPMYLDGRGFGVDAARYDWALRSPAGLEVGREQRVATLGPALSAIVDAASQAPSRPKVWVVHAVPELGFSPVECVISRPVDRLVARREPCALDHRLVQERQREAREFVASMLSRGGPRVSGLDPLPLLCDDARCWARREGALLYADSDHLSAQGAALVLSALPQ